jgi:hypothetical protein
MKRHFLDVVLRLIAATHTLVAANEGAAKKHVRAACVVRSRVALRELRAAAVHTRLWRQCTRG